MRRPRGCWRGRWRQRDACRPVQRRSESSGCAGSPTQTLRRRGRRAARPAAKGGGVPAAACPPRRGGAAGHMGAQGWACDDRSRRKGCPSYSGRRHMRGEGDSLAAALEAVVDLDLEDHFVFEIGEPRPITAEPRRRAPHSVIARLDGREFERLQLDVTRGTPPAHRDRQLRGLLDFAGMPAPAVPLSTWRSTWPRSSTLTPVTTARLRTVEHATCSTC